MKPSDLPDLPDLPDLSERELSTPCSFSMPPSLQKAISDLAKEFGMSKSAFVTGLLESDVIDLRSLLRNNAHFLDVAEADNPRELRRLGSSATLVDHRHDVIRAALRRHRNGH